MATLHCIMLQDNYNKEEAVKVLQQQGIDLKHLYAGQSYKIF